MKHFKVRVLTILHAFARDLRLCGAGRHHASLSKRLTQTMSRFVPRLLDEVTAPTDSPRKGRASNA